MVVLREGLRAGAADAGHDGFGFFVGVDGAGGLEVVGDGCEGGEGGFWCGGGGVSACFGVNDVEKGG